MGENVAVPRLVSDEPTATDGLGRDDLAQHIATVVRTLPPPFTVAVYGGWGEGKTSLLRNVQQKVSTPPAAGDGGEVSPVVCHTVWFDLWQHQDDVNPVLAMLALARAERKGLKKKASQVLDAVIPALWTALDHLPTVSVGGEGGPRAELSMAGVASDYMRHRDARRADRMAVLDAQVRLHDLFRKALDQLAGDGRLVFFIDDLDRCLPENVVDLLEKIRLFLNHERCVFVLGVDDQAVERAIQQAKNYDDPRVAGRYLEKMIQYAFDLPPVEPDQRKEFVRRTLREAIPGGSLSDDQADTIVDLWEQAFDDPEVDASVRFAVRTINTFAVDHAIGVERLGDQRYDPTIMAVISVIKTCYREAFVQLRRHHKDREGKFWRGLFHFYDQDPDNMLGSLFRRSGPRWKDQPDGREPDGAKRSGWPFVQAVQGSLGAGPVSDGFPRLAEDHFRFAVSTSLRDVEPESVEPPPEVSTRPKHVPATPRTPDPAVAPTGDRPGDVLDPARSDAPRHIVRSHRLDGLVDYWTRPPSTVEEVSEVCQEIARETWSAGSPPVRLSGIDWRVLTVTPEGPDRRALLLADRVIGAGPYNEAKTAMTWERCDLRRWLNNEFLESIGDPFVSRVLRVEVKNESNPAWNVGGGRDTRDQFFLLSMNEAVHHLAGEESCDWAKLKKAWIYLGKWGVATDEEGFSSWWWLRSPGATRTRVTSVAPGGGLTLGGRYGSVDVSADGGVRPAFWLDLQS
ncbi:MAG: KAP family NTPase [Micrococcales bacterium]|nr:KAP family NTPase [Micrococcales bacterium]